MAWVVAVHQNEGITKFSEIEIMNMLTFSDKLHSLLQTRCKRENEFLCVDEVVHSIPLPLRFKTKLYYGHNLRQNDIDCIPSMEDIIAFDDLQNILQAKTACILTCNNHNVAIYCDKS